MIALVAATGMIIVSLPGAYFAWLVFGPSVISIRNVGGQSAQLVLTDADHSTQVWSGVLDPGRRKTVMIWFKHEGSPELRCRDRTSSNSTGLDYVTGYMPITANITIAGCGHIDPTLK